MSDIVQGPPKAARSLLLKYCTIRNYATEFYSSPCSWPVASKATTVLPGMDEIIARLNSIAASIQNEGMAVWVAYEAHMARVIQAESGKDALVQTITQGPLSYIRLYNSLGPEEERLSLRQSRDGSTTARYWWQKARGSIDLENE